MNNINDLKALLYDDIKEDNNKRESLKQIETIIAMYRDLIELFNIRNIESIQDNLLAINIILECIYDKKTIEAFNLEGIVYGYLNSSIKQEKDKFKKLISNLLYKFRLDVEFEINKYENIYRSLLTNEEIITTRKIISSLKYKQNITDKQKEFITKRLEKANINIKDIIIILEKINIHNAEILKSKGVKIRYADLYSLINLLNLGYEKIELNNIKNPAVDEFCKKFVDTLDNSPVEMIKELLNSLSYYPKDVLEYIYKKILIYYQNSMFDTIETLKDDNCYFDNDIISIIKDDYYELYRRYVIVRDALDELYKIEEVVETVEEEKIEEEKIHLYYSTNNMDEANKCWFIKDLMDIREESLERILADINEFKKGTSNKLKPLKGKHGFSEIKDDQIRIIFKPIGLSQAIIMGVFIKKDTNDRDMFNKLTERSLELTSEEYNKEVEEFFTNYIKENSRKGTR